MSEDDFSGSLGSDFGEMEDEYECDSDGNPINAPKIGKGNISIKTLKAQDKAEQKEDLDGKRKRKALEKLDRKIKGLQKRHDREGTVKMENPGDIRNKHKRQEIVLKKRMSDRRVAKLEHLKVKKIREELGEAAAPKGTTNTIESMRVKDETIITEVDDEIKGEQEIDEFASYFKQETTPRILMTTNRRPNGKIFEFMKEIKTAFPGCEYYERGNFLIKKVIEWAKERGFTDLMLWYEKHGKPHSLILSHLPEGPTATFRVSSIKLRHNIVDHGAAPGDVHPELILNNFDTMLGHRMGRMLASLFPQNPHLQSRRVVTLHNQRDFVFFRHHRYEFNKDGTRANLQEVGPRFTLKLHSLQLGTMDKKHGEFEFIYKPRDGVNRKKFFM